MRKEEALSCEYIRIDDSVIAGVTNQVAKVVTSNTNGTITFEVYGSEPVEKRTYHTHFAKATVVDKNAYKEFVEAKLIKEAKSFGLRKGVRHTGASLKGEHIAMTDKMYYEVDYDELVLDSFVIYRDGKWADIIVPNLQKNPQD